MYFDECTDRHEAHEIMLIGHQAMKAAWRKRHPTESSSSSSSSSDMGGSSCSDDETVYSDANTDGDVDHKPCSSTSLTASTATDTDVSSREEAKHSGENLNSPTTISRIYQHPTYVNDSPAEMG